MVKLNLIKTIDRQIAGEKITAPIKKITKKRAKWLSDRITLKKHYNKLPKGEDGFFKNIDEESCKYMRVSLENADRFVDEENKEKRKEKQKITLESNQKIMNSFIWDEDLLIEKKVFPMDIHNGIFYYGLMLPKNIEEITSKGVRLGMKQKNIPCIITSDKQILEVNKRLEEDYKLDFENLPTYLPNRWRLKNIKSFLDGSNNPINNKKFLKKITKQYEKYLYRRNKIWYKISAVWDIGTYFYMIFEAYPLYEHRGLSGTAKSKEMTISSFISFNGGQIMVNPSEATLFRETDEVRGSKYFDEAEKLWVFNKSTKQYEGDVRTELINASYTKEAKVPRQEKLGNKFYTKWYSPYSPTRLSSINGLYGSTENRAITQITTKSPNKDERGELEPTEDRNNPIWAEIRDECYRFALNNWGEIKKIYNNFPKDIGLKRRDYQIWKPILAITKFISKEDYQEILKFAIEQSKMRLDDLVPESSFDFMCLSALKETIEIYSNSDKHYLEKIKNCFCSQQNKSSEDRNNIYLNRNIGTHLKRLGFDKKRDKIGNYIIANKSIFNEIVSPICPQLVFLSTLPTLSTPLHTNTNKIGVDRVSIGVDKENKDNIKKISKKTEIIKNNKNLSTPLTKEGVDSIDNVAVQENKGNKNFKKASEEIPIIEAEEYKENGDNN